MNELKKLFHHLNVSIVGSIRSTLLWTNNNRKVCSLLFTTLSISTHNVQSATELCDKFQRLCNSSEHYVLDAKHSFKQGGSPRMQSGVTTQFQTLLFGYNAAGQYGQQGNSLTFQQSCVEPTIRVPWYEIKTWSVFWWVGKKKTQSTDRWSVFMLNQIESLSSATRSAISPLCCFSSPNVNPTYSAQSRLINKNLSKQPWGNWPSSPLQKKSEGSKVNFRKCYDDHRHRWTLHQARSNKKPNKIILQTSQKTVPCHKKVDIW